MKTTGVSSNGVTGSVDEIMDRFDEAKIKVKNKADQYIAKGMAGAESAGEAISEANERLSEKIDGMVKQSWKAIRNTSENAEVLVKKHPVATVAALVGISFVAGYFAAKSTRR